MAKFDLHKFLEVLKVVGPMVLTVVPGAGKIAPVIPTIINGIGEAEAIKGSGKEKKQHVKNVVAAGVEVANTTGKLDLDPAEVDATVDHAIDTVVSVINVIAGAKIDKRPPAQMSKE